VTVRTPAERPRIECLDRDLDRYSAQANLSTAEKVTSGALVSTAEGARGNVLQIRSSVGTKQSLVTDMRMCDTGNQLAVRG